MLGVGAEAMDPSLRTVSMTTSIGGPLLGDSVGVERVVVILCVIEVVAMKLRTRLVVVMKLREMLICESCCCRSCEMRDVKGVESAGV